MPEQDSEAIPQPAHKGIMQEAATHQREVGGNPLVGRRVDSLEHTLGRLIDTTIGPGRIEEGRPK